MPQTPVGDAIQKARETLTTASDSVESYAKTNISYSIDDTCKSDFHRYRKQYGAPIILGSVVATALVSAPFGKIRAVRNGMLIGAIATFVTSPEVFYDALQSFANR